MFDLKPCPFCGEKPYLFVRNGVKVLCLNCRASSISLSDDVNTKGEATSSVKNVIEAWNHRVAPQEANNADKTL